MRSNSNRAELNHYNCAVSSDSRGIPNVRFQDKVVTTLMSAKGSNICRPIAFIVTLPVEGNGLR